MLNVGDVEASECSLFFCRFQLRIKNPEKFICEDHLAKAKIQLINIWVSLQNKTILTALYRLPKTASRVFLNEK